MGVRRRHACLASIGAAVVVLGSSCQEHTAIVLEVRTNLRANELSGVSFTVGAPGDTENARATTTTNAATVEGADTFIGTLVVVPGTSDDAPLSIKIVASIGKPVEQCTPNNGYFGCIVARRSLRYSPHVRLHLPILLEADCLNVPCNATTTCSKGACVDSQASCSGTGCALPGEAILEDGGLVLVDAPTNPDGYVSNDASTRDAGDASESGDAADGGMKMHTVQCNASLPCTGTDVCCVDTVTRYCMSSGVCPAPAVTITCDGKEDCPDSLFCCITSSGTGSGSTCVSMCSPATELCHGDTDCHRINEHCSSTYANMYKKCM